MGLIKHFLKIIIIFFSLNVSNVFAVLIDPQYGRQAPDIETPIINDCSGAGGMSISDCRDEMTRQISDQIENYGDGTSARMTVRNGITFTRSQTNLAGSQGTWIEYKYQNPERWVKYSQSNISKNASIIIESVPQCPDPNHPDYRVPRFVDINDNQVLYCFDQTDLNFRDSCPDSTQDGAYVLPKTATNSSSVMCLDKPDGSSCKYEQVGDVYVTDFENNCYELNGVPRFDETGIDHPDPAERDCQQLGQGVTACIEDPANVCDSQGLCNTGCGNVAFAGNDPLFVCLSGDTDGDGLADYLDPDLDGDGIRNEDDLDSDGDGKDDPTYPTNKNSDGMEFSSVELESLANETNNLTAQGNSTLESIKDELETQNGSGLMPAFSVSQDQDVQNQNVYNKIAASELVQAFSGVANFINFGTGTACPAFSFYMPSPIDKQVGTNIHCELMPSIAAVLSPVMAAIYLFFGFRIFTSA
tara:strand:+ start:2476 stop:3891 length:1416 start_codon:yes stop_codon:yes gene_type:complete